MKQSIGSYFIYAARFYAGRYFAVRVCPSYEASAFLGSVPVNEAASLGRGRFYF